jgi:hypothetical protein
MHDRRRGAVEDVDASIEVQDGRLTMTAGGETTAYVSGPDRQPLGAGETHAVVRVAGDDCEATVALDRAQLDALIDALVHAREAPDDA